MKKYRKGPQDGEESRAPREYVERSPIRQKKSLGQVFLKEKWPVERMAQWCVDNGVKRVLEIGPGMGILTDALLEKNLDVTVIEKDSRYAALMSIRENMRTINQDVLEFDLAAWIAESPEPTAVVGNIPYNISTPILLWTLEQLPKIVGGLFMVQLEFAKRIAADCDNEDYGSISVYTQLRSNAELLFNVSRGTFRPIPKVDSAVLQVLPRSSSIAPEVLKKTETITRAAFNQRRKKLRNAVKPFLGERIDDPSPIDLNRRPQTLTPEEFVDLARFVFEI